MKTPNQPVALPLDYVAQIIFELYSMRGECSDVAKHLMRQRPLDERHLDECARLDDALGQAYGVLQGAVDTIKASRAKRSPTSW